MLLKVCLNGARGLEEHPALTADPEVLASDASDAVAAGAAAIHVHPKNEDGADSLAAVDVDRWVAAMRTACPGVPVGVTTGAWAAPDPADRLSQISGWRVRPDFASVNWHEPGADEVAACLARQGIGVEAGIWDADGLARWRRSSWRTRCVRILLELPPSPSAGIADLAGPWLRQVRVAAPRTPVLLHGEDLSAWPAVDLAVDLGLDTRIGLEDTLLTPDGRRAADNAELVRALRRRLGSRPGSASAARPQD